MTTVREEIDSIKQHIAAAYEAVNDKKGTIPANKNCANVASAISSISKDATAVAGDILSGKTAYAKGEKLTGTIQTYDGSYVVNPTIPSLAEATWEQINEVSQAGTANQYWAVGDEKTITLTTGEEVTLQILGFNHDKLTTGGKAGITFGTKNALINVYPMNSTFTNSGGWKESVMRTTTMGKIYSNLPSEIQTIIKPVDKVTGRQDLSNALETTQFIIK